MEKPALTKVTAGCKPLTTFVQTDTNSFREVVQRLTGPSEPNNAAQQEIATTSNKVMPPKRQTPATTSKLHERRQYMRPKLEIVKPTFNFRSPFPSPTDLNKSVSPSKLSNNDSCVGSLTSPLGTPSTMFSTLSIEEKKKGESVELNSQEEERAIQERRFYLHPSPRGRPGYTEPELLTLFPLSSPTSKKNP
ncbi:VQ motif containing protein [Parasponia andersonii]|uniref:VQ motif containing protein n=1 Tax=Parasponia andersonii TaxID=3476 RepID=A0A2P5CQG1_PARAD|nr:VQ motif containing protein [Parasponia andersonii]